MTNIERQILLNQLVIMSAMSTYLLETKQVCANKSIEQLLKCSEVTKNMLKDDANCLDKIYTEEDL